MKLEKKDDEYYKLVEADEVLAGCFCGVVPENIVCKVQHLPMDNHNTKSIMGFYVNSNMQNKGIGKKFMNEIIDYEKNSGTLFITLGVNKENEFAIRLYTSCGFKIEGDCNKDGVYYLMYIDLRNN